MDSAGGPTAWQRWLRDATSLALENKLLNPLPQPTHDLWLFSPRVDLLAFGGSFVASMLLLALGWPLGLTQAETPDLVWIGAILLIDVAHVYATGFRVYFVPSEFKRRPWLYGATPVLAFIGCWLLIQQGTLCFWRALAYLAVFHFVRQQYGWVALYRRRESDQSRAGWWIDATAIYAATIFPLIYWHTHPRNFAWFTPEDFFALPTWISPIAATIYVLALSAYAVRSITCAWSDRWNPGKDLVVATTAILWFVGIVVFDSDYAFTVTNVVPHGIPYLVLVYWYGHQQRRSNAAEEKQVEEKPMEQEPASGQPRWLKYMAVVWLMAYAEEFLWDVSVWHERSWLFGTPQDWSAYHAVLLPLLAVPQITHYVLDGFIWRRTADSSSRVPAN